MEFTPEQLAWLAQREQQIKANQAQNPYYQLTEQQQAFYMEMSDRGIPDAMCIQAAQILTLDRERTYTEQNLMTNIHAIIMNQGYDIPPCLDDESDPFEGIEFNPF